VNPCPKNSPYRNQKLRDAAKDVPHCMSCGAANVGQIVLAHSNRLSDGKGMGIKAADVPCFVCNECHDIIDGRRFLGTDHEARIDMLRLEATYNSVLWCLQEGVLK